MASARTEIPPALEIEVRRRVEAGEVLDTIHAWLKGAGWPGSRATLANRIAEMRARPEAELRRQMEEIRAAPPGPESPTPETPPAATEEPRDTLTELRESQALMRALARRAVVDVQKGRGSLALALKAVDLLAGLTLKIRRLEKQEKPAERNYRMIEVRLPAKDTIQ